MAMALPPQRQAPLPPPPLSINTPPPMDVASLISDPNSMSYPTPSSTSTTRQLPPTSAMEPLPESTLHDGRIYSLDIVQQPVRARMCGFGDKDRRPITPPPCIRLVVKDAETGKELDINDIETAYYVLTVALWSGDATKEVSLVKHSATSPSISATTASSYPPLPEEPLSRAWAPTSTATIGQYQIPTTYGQDVTSSLAAAPIYGLQYPQSVLQRQNLTFPQTSMAGATDYWMGPTATPMTPGQGPLLSPSALSNQSCDPRSHPNGMFTRNLIGSLCVNAFKLTNPENQMGVWFILQDLSVRTEGSFRLKMNFVNVGSSKSSELLNTSSAPVLASCFSNEFQVYSAKKFPGVIESTSLSKCFATQGIKIPIRKDGVRGNERRPDDDDD